MKTTENILQRKRKFYLLLPLFLLPFIALGFYALGGGRSPEKPSQGLVNTALPDAKFNRKDSLSRLDLYQRSDRDSSQASSGLAEIAARMGLGESTANDKASAVEERMAELQKEIRKAQEEPQPAARPNRSSTSPSMKADLDRLEALMQAMQQPKDEDPELAQLNQLTSSIKDIMQPERMTSVRRTSGASQNPFKAFKAEIDGKQKVSAGASVRLRLLDTLVIRDKTLLPGQLLFGTCRLANHRLLLDIESIRDGEILLPADLTVYSLDGMPGIDAPEAELAGAAGYGADNAMRGIGIGSLDQTMATQVAAAGIEATKSLLSKKVRSIKVRLKDNYPILLRDNQQKIK